MKSGDKWEKREVLTELSEGSGKRITGYYLRKLMTRHDRSAHIFFCEMADEKELAAGWENIVNLAATYVQGEVEDPLERSNFYIWFFVGGPVEKNLRKKIEDDTYSTKKFIVAPTGELEEAEKLEIAEKRLFTLNFPTHPSDRQMLTKAVIKDFRGYRGTKTFDFQTGQGPARLAVLFAPNGMGKTGFFDGVEWNLTGAVNRFKNIGNPNTVLPVLKNLGAPKKDRAFVCLHFTSGDWIKRTVTQLGGNVKKDTGKGRTEFSEGCSLKDMVGREYWKNLILQHHKIDGFIAASAPQDLYKEWGGFWDPDGVKRKEFEESHKKAKKKQGKLDAAAARYDELTAQYRNLDRTRGFVGGLEEDVHKYYELTGRKICAEQDFWKMTAESYTEWGNYVDKELHAVYARQEQNKKDLIYLEDSINRDCENYGRFLRRKKETQEEIRFLEKKIEDCRRKKELLMAQPALERRRTEVEKALSEYRFLHERGADWYNRAKEYFGAVSKMQDLRADIESAREMTRSTVEKAEKTGVELGHKQEELREEKQYHKLRGHMEEIDRLNAVKQEQEEQRISAGKKLEAVENEIASQQREMKRLLDRQYHSFRELLDGYRVGELFAEENDQTLNDLRETLATALEKYEKREALLEKIDAGIREEERVEAEIGRLLEESRRLISKQRRTACPVCHTQFTDTESLIQGTYRTVSEKGEALKKQRAEQAVKLAELEKRAGVYLDGFHLRLTELVKGMEERRAKREKYRLKVKNSINDLELQIAKTEADIARIVTEDKAQGVYVIYTVEGIENWRVNWRQKTEAELQLLERRAEENARGLESCRKRLEELHASEEKQEAKLRFAEECPQDVFTGMKTAERVIREHDDYGGMEKRFTKLVEEAGELAAKADVYREQAENLRETGTEMEPLYLERKQALEDGAERAEKEAQQYAQRMEAVLRRFRGGDCGEGFGSLVFACAKRHLMEETELLAGAGEILDRLKYNHEVENYFAKWEETSRQVREAETLRNRTESEAGLAWRDYQEQKALVERDMQNFLHNFQISDIYEKLEPHEEMKRLTAQFGFSEDEKPELTFQVQDDHGKSYPPEWYFSTAQLNTVAFSVFLGRALQTEDVPIKSIFIDDPVGHFDEMNVVGFVDLLRNIVENTDRQLIISTHEENVYGLIRRKLPEEEYPVRYFDFRKEF